MVDPEVLFAHRARTKQIKTEVERLFGDEIRAAEVAEARARARAIAIVKRGSVISGVPDKGARVGAVEITPARVMVSIERYCGEGEWAHERYIRFPPRWLGMPDADWITELRAECGRTVQARIDAANQKAAKAAQDQERFEREQLAHLLAKYCENEASS